MLLMLQNQDQDLLADLSIAICSSLSIREYSIRKSKLLNVVEWSLNFQNYHLIMILYLLKFLYFVVLGICWDAG